MATKLKYSDIGSARPCAECGEPKNRHSSNGDCPTLDGNKFVSVGKTTGELHEIDFEK